MAKECDYVRREQLAGGLVFSAVAGCIIGFFYPQLMRSISPNFNSQAIAAGRLTPYLALVFFGLGVLASNFIINTVPACPARAGAFWSQR